jgi:hypothetical protein
MARAKKARSRAGGGAKKAAKAAEKKAAAEARKVAAAKKKKAAKTAGKAAKGAKKATASKTKPRRASAARTARKGRAGAAGTGDPTLFAPLTEGERADALRVLTEDKRLSQLAKIGRYRVINVEPLTVKLPESLAGHRLVRVVIYDYASDRAVDAAVDLDTSDVASLSFSRCQPMLARDEEAAAIEIALAEERVKQELSLGDEPQVAMHYWSDRDTDLAYRRRSAAVLFGRPGARPSLVAVVDLLDSVVTDVVPAEQW